MNYYILGVSFLWGLGSYIGYLNHQKIKTYMVNKIGQPIIDGAGYLGGAMQLGAVVAVSRGWLTNTSATYHTISLLGSTGLLATAFYHEAYAPVLVNLIWMGMNMVGILENIDLLSANVNTFKQINPAMAS